jgi:hypothetical protein
MRLTEPGCPGSCIYFSQEQVKPVIPPSTGLSLLSFHCDQPRGRLWKNSLCTDLVSHAVWISLITNRPDSRHVTSHSLVFCGGLWGTLFSRKFLSVSKLRNPFSSFSKKNSSYGPYRSAYQLQKKGTKLRVPTRVLCVCLANMYAPVL